MRSCGDRTGIIAGSGDLPVFIARSLSRSGEDIFVAGLNGAAHPSIAGTGWETQWYDVHVLGKLLEGLKRAGVKRVVLAGRVGHDEIFRIRQFDDHLKELFGSLSDFRPSTILAGLVDMFTRNGFEVLSLIEVASGLLPEPGRITGPCLDPHQIEDLKFGWKVTRGIADLDIGQTTAVKSRAVVAVEAMEGTDKTIERAGVITGGGFTVVKLAARFHDFRYDVPTVGVETIERLAKAGGSLLAVEAGRSILLGHDEIVYLCQKRGITLLACREDETGEVHWPPT